MKKVLYVISTVLIVLLTMWGVDNFVPFWIIEKLSVHEPIVGSTITTILGTDTLSASRPVINTNFSNLNTDKLEAGSTASTLTVTTFTTQTMYASTTNVVNGVFSTLTGGVATVGQLIATSTATSSSSGGFFASLISAPYFHATSSTASSTFAGGVSIAASGTSTAFTLNGRNWVFPMSYNASNSVFMTNGQGVLSLVSTNKVAGVTSTSTGSIGPIVITHGLNRTPRTIRVWASASCSQDGTAGHCTSTGIAHSATTTITNTDNQSAVSYVYRVGAQTGRVSNGVVLNLIDGSENINVSAIVSAVTSTTFTLNFTVNHNSGAIRVLAWEVE